MTHEQYNERVYLVDRISTTAARKLSTTVPGVFFVGNYYISHATSSRRRADVFLDRREIADIEAARAIVNKLVGTDTGSYTYAQLARDVTTWLEIRQPAFQKARELVPNWHYQKCDPWELDDAGMYDMTAAYWQVVNRVPSPKFDILRGRIVWHNLLHSQRRRWDAMREAVAPHKKLRLAIVGVNAAGWAEGRSHFHGTIAYKDGKPHTIPVLNGALQPMSLLSVRTIYELTQMQAEACDAVYSNADCVVTEARDLRVWDRWGIEYGCKARGRTRVNSIGSWEIGRKRTKPFHPRGFIMQHDPVRIETTYHNLALSA